jgi:hypothetical protein
MQRVRRLLSVMLLLLAACSAAPTRGPTAVPTPALRLLPSALGRSVALQQRLEFRVDGRREVLEALLEVDANDVRLALQGAGQVALRLHWDGRSLQEVRADWLPAALTGERVLSDLQLVLWPAEAVRTALPAGWRIEEREQVRELLRDDDVIARIAYRGESEARLQHIGAGYELRVQSQAAAR